VIADYNDKRETLAELIAFFRRCHACSPYGSEMRVDFARCIRDLTGLDEDAIRMHHFQHIAIEYEAPPIPRNKGARPRNAVQPGAMA